MTLLPLLLTLPFVCPHEALANPRFVEQSSRAESANAFGRSGWAQVDLNGDGIPELVVDGTVVTRRTGSYLALLTLETTGPGTIRQTSSIQSSYEPNYPGSLLAWPAAAGDKVVTISRAGRVVIHSGLPLRAEREFDCITDVSSAAIGDIDGDGADELITVGFNGINVYALANGQWLRGYPIDGVTGIALAQLDADPALEVILGGVRPGVILDGATFATDWQYVDGFGSSLAVGKLAGHGRTRWVGADASSSRFSIFQSDPWSPIWSGTGGFSHIAAVEGADARGFISAVEWDYAIRVYDSATRELLYRLSTAATALKLNSTAGFDMDRDGVPEIAIGAGRASYDNGISMLALADAASGTYRWQWTPARGPYVTAAWGDVDGDGRQELVAAAQFEYLLPGGNLEIFDADSNRSLWRSDEAEDFSRLSTSRVLLRPRAGSAGQDIVLAGQTRTGGESHLIVVDGLTRSVVFDRFGGFLENFLDLTLMPRADGGVDDFGVAVDKQTNFSTVLQRRLGTNGALLWESQEQRGTAHQLLHVPAVDANPGALVAVMHDGLNAYDAATGAPSWTIPVPNVGAAYVPTGATGPELAVFTEYGKLHFYDASTRVLLREFSLPTPIRVVTTLGGDVRRLIVAADARLLLLDGSTGQTLAQTEPMAWFPERGGQIIVRRVSNDVWQLASGTGSALYRHRLELRDEIFTSGFDGAP